MSENLIDSCWDLSLCADFINYFVLFRNVLQNASQVIKPDETGELNVVINIDEFVAANLDGGSDESDEISEEEYLSHDLKRLVVNPVLMEEESWE